MKKSSGKIKNDNIANFLHIGKTGGSAIISAIKSSLSTERYNIKIWDHDVKLPDIPKGEKVFFFLRDPTSRFVSGFYSRQRKGQPRYNNEWSKFEKEVFMTFSTPNELAISLLDNTMPNYDLAVTAMNDMVHFSSYYSWFKNIEYFRSRENDILFIGFQESLDEDFEKLKEVLNLPVSITLPTDDIAAHRNPAHLNTSLSSDSIVALNRWYACDISFIATCKELVSDL